MITILKDQLMMDAEVLSYATNEEIEQLQEICKNIKERAAKEREEK